MGISDEIEVATNVFDETTILKIKATIALPFRSSFTQLAPSWGQRDLQKSVLHVPSFCFAY